MQYAHADLSQPELTLTQEESLRLAAPNMPQVHLASMSLRLVKINLIPAQFLLLQKRLLTHCVFNQNY